MRYGCVAAHDGDGGVSMLCCDGETACWLMELKGRGRLCGWQRVQECGDELMQGVRGERYMRKCDVELRVSILCWKLSIRLDLRGV